MKKLLLNRYRNAIPTINAMYLSLLDEAGAPYFQQRLKEILAAGLKTKEQAQDAALFAVLLVEKLDGATQKPTQKASGRQDT